MSRRIVWRGKYLHVVEDTVDGPDGTAVWECIERPGVRDIVAVLPVTEDGNVVLIEQYRAAYGDRVLELPAGLNDVSGESLPTAARRELLEETGYRARSLTKIPFTPECSGLTALRVHVFIAHHARRARAASQRLDAAERASQLTVREFPIANIEATLADYQRRTGKAVDLKIIAACAYWRMLREEKE